MYLYKSSVCTSQETHHASATEVNWLMLFREIIAIYCENHMKNTHIYSLYSVSRKQSFSMLKQMVHIVTSGF
jgi:hypothetical protein